MTRSTRTTTRVAPRPATNQVQPSPKSSIDASVSRFPVSSVVDWATLAHPRPHGYDLGASTAQVQARTAVSERPAHVIGLIRETNRVRSVSVRMLRMCGDATIISS